MDSIAERENAWEKWEGVDSSAERMPGTSGRVWTRLLRERMPGKSRRVWTRVPRESAREKWAGLDSRKKAVYSEVLRGRRESRVGRSVACFYKGILCMTREYPYFLAVKP